MWEAKQFYKFIPTFYRKDFWLNCTIMSEKFVNLRLRENFYVFIPRVNNWQWKFIFWNKMEQIKLHCVITHLISKVWFGFRCSQCYCFCFFRMPCLHQPRLWKVIQFRMTCKNYKSFWQEWIHTHWSLIISYMSIRSPFFKNRIRAHIAVTYKILFMSRTC